MPAGFTYGDEVLEMVGQLKLIDVAGMTKDGYSPVRDDVSSGTDGDTSSSESPYTSDSEWGQGRGSCGQPGATGKAGGA